MNKCLFSHRFFQCEMTHRRDFHLIVGHFRQYDHGFLGNIKLYRQITPPDYDLTKVTAPGYLFHAYNDWVCAITDVERLYKKLKNVRGKFLIPEKTFNHLDFIFGTGAPELVYRDVLRMFSLH